MAKAKKTAKDKKHDPKEVFVVHFVTRENIAKDLNDFLDRKEFWVDDPRLTEGVCKDYAKMLGDISDSLEEQCWKQEEATTNGFKEAFLIKMGFIGEDEE